MRAHFVLGIVAVVGCSRPDPPTIVPRRATLERIDATGIELSVELTATNPNSVDLTVSDVTSRVVVGSEKVGTLSLPATTVLPAGKTTTIVVPVSVNWPDVASLARIAAIGNAVPYSVEGTLDLGANLMHVGFPFHLDGSIPRDQIVSAALNSIPGLPR